MTFPFPHPVQDPIAFLCVLFIIYILPVSCKSSTINSLKYSFLLTVYFYGIGLVLCYGL